MDRKHKPEKQYHLIKHTLWPLVS